MSTFFTATLLLLAISNSGVWAQYYYSQYGNSGYGSNYYPNYQHGDYYSGYQHQGGGSGGHAGGHADTNVIGSTFGGHERSIGDEHFKLKLWPEFHLR
ncbi:hypothetical protein DdX_17569 [Ditylenchus destructor]|uniref:Uncharacterized protein n=1 Tax=Ditylenchus destructor TaxID=166010 RepID=A0AAD4QYW8_9BILA|nr:hypothetical protein DdX_17569 [Ditylenchus destructor]